MSNKDKKTEEKVEIPIRFANIMRDCGINNIEAFKRAYQVNQNVNQSEENKAIDSEEVNAKE